jgi:parallel beta-helix repeat protein
LTLDGLNVDLTPFESLDLRVRSPAAIKIRVILKDRDQQEVRFHEKLPSPNNWHRMRFHLSQAYRGSADLSAITAICIQATSELENCEFSIGQACFIRGLKLAHDRIHPDTVKVLCNGRTLQQGQDFEVDLERGEIWLMDDQPASIRYRHGGGTIKLAPGNYYIEGEQGIQLRSHCNLELQGATLIAADSYDGPGQLMQTVPGFSHTSISIKGGLLRGQRMKWPTRQNISGIVIRDTDNVLIEKCEIVDFNSAGIAVVNSRAKESGSRMPRRVCINGNRLSSCATEYVDIRDDLYGEVGAGADHKAMLRLAGIREFEICNNRFEDSFGDAKWIVGCEDGVISGNLIENSRMGSYFIERSRRVIGTANLIRNAGSRAVTIERGSHENTFSNNIIINSYREGLWLMGCSECLIQGNRFENNGWRNSEGLDSAIKIEWQQAFANDKASNNLITQNFIKTQSHQDQAIWIVSGSNSAGNVVTDNLIIGAKVPVRDEGSETIAVRNQVRE